VRRYIEGAIGSEYKVDASYLSPNVNMSARLEAATKQFGVPLLLSEDFVNILSPHVQPECRQIDRVTVKGSIEPIGIFTYDTNVEVGRFRLTVSKPKFKARLVSALETKM
jgi:class 3 adenylate cyclase